MVGVIIGAVILVLLVAVHELGHGIVARRNGVGVKEFGIGFPPLAWGRKLKQSFLGRNVLFSVNWLPLGGFVRLQGEYDSANKKGDYGAASYWVKTKILFAGVMMNWLVAAVLLSILAATGMPQILKQQFSVPGVTTYSEQRAAEYKANHVGEGLPAYQAGLRDGDKIIAINGVNIVWPTDLTDATQRHKGQVVQIRYIPAAQHSAQPRELSVQLRSDNSDGKGYLGMGLTGHPPRTVSYSSWASPIVGVGTTAQLSWLTLSGTGDILMKLGTGLVSKLSGDVSTRQAGDAKLAYVSDSVAGPLGILGKIFPSAQSAGLTPLVFLTAIISLSLAVMNILPIPALDGGRWLVMTIYRLRRKVLTREREEQIQSISMMVLLGLVLLVTIADIGKLGK
jgi:regulator of sigma E protease